MTIDEILTKEFKRWHDPDDSPYWEMSDVQYFSKSVAMLVAEECIKICGDVSDSGEGFDDSEYYYGRQMGIALCISEINNKLGLEK